MMSLPGQFAVNQNGAGTYVVPIALPPGTGGMTPTLSLEYNSQGANGILGVGWTLGGLPSIVRCPRTIAQDGVLGGVNYDASDRFCLEGQRLVVVSGSYGADGAVYRTEVDTFSKIISHGTAGAGPAWFEVHTKSGQVMEFGHTTDSLILAQGKTTARVWALDKISDSKTNYFTVTYTNDTTNGQFYPNRVDYTGNTAASMGTYNSVQFSYVTRPDIIPRYQAGSLSQITVRLTDVKTFSANSLISDYKIGYQQGSTSNRSELVSIAVCGGDGSCLPPTSIAWTSDASASFAVHTQTAPANYGSPPSNNCVSLSGDFNGDGKSDFVLVCGSNISTFLSNGDSTFAYHSQAAPGNFGAPPSNNCVTLGGDFNADGKSDFMLFCGANINTFLSNGDGTFAYHSQTASANYGSPPSTNCSPYGGDFNGDGRSDFTMVCGANANTFLSNGDGTFAYRNQTAPANYGAPPNNNCASIGGDFNFDGKSDIALFCGTNINIFLSNGDGTFTFSDQVASANFGSPPSNNCATLGGDFNGDGNSDFLLICGANINAFLSSGNGTFVFRTQTAPANFGSPPTTNCTPFGGDYDGDGKSDFMLVCGTNINTFISNGDGTFIYHNQTVSTSYGAPPTVNCAPLDGDFDGDGKSDFLLFCGANINVSLSNAGYGGLVTSVTTGLGATTTIIYSALTSGAVYSKDATATYPQMDVQYPYYVVSRVDASNGVGGTYSSTYKYAGAKMDLSGRGFLGFRQMTVTDLQTGISDTTNYHQDFPYLGLVASTTRSVGSQTLGQSTNTYQFSNASGGATIGTSSAPYQVSLSQNVSSGADLDGTALPTVTTTNQYDAYGNATQVGVSTSDGFSKTTANTYTNDTTNWYLGRLTGASVTSVAP